MMDRRYVLASLFFGPLLAAVGVCVMVAGCGSGEESSEAGDAKIAALARLYGDCTAQQGRAPADEAGFREFLNGLPDAQRKAMGLENLDQAFTSPRDGKPYVVVYGSRAGLRRGEAGLHGQPVVMFEQEGEQGKRLVANAMGATAEVNEMEFARMMPQPGTR